MRRLFWVGLGAAGTVVVAGRVRRVVRRYTPAAVGEQVEAAGRRTTSALQDAVIRFHTAKDAREKDLLASLLVTPDGGDAGAVLGRHRDRSGSHAATGSAPAERTPAADAARPAHRTSTATDARPSGRVDEDEPLYDF